MHKRSEPICAYFYDLDALAGHVQAMRHALPLFCELFYAVKANAAPPLLHVLASLCDGFEVASGGELAHIRRYQPQARLLFGGPGKLESELEAALFPPIEALHVESLHELELIHDIAEKKQCVAPIMVRLNLPRGDGAATRLVMSGTPSAFGIDEAHFEQALTVIRNSKWLSFKGLHLHAQSHQCDAAEHGAMLRGFLRHINELEDCLSFHAPIINLGGGMGVAYQEPHHHFDWPSFCQMLQNLPNTERRERHFRFEVGRFMTAFCGVYAMEVIDLKQSYGEWFAIARGGTHHFRLPSAQAHSHPIHVVRASRPPDITHQQVTVTGQLCTPKDVLARHVPIEALAPGDVFLLPMAGAYGWSISHHDFLMHPPPHHYFIQKDRIWEEKI
ncbi:siderophore biosynthesis PLP-dependent protein [Saccharibacter sp. 17.LH.SD]|nr:siderophore biosynthesis PLP-dependent protein [Saccharibacter sp. 17.LH.SD]